MIIPAATFIQIMKNIKETLMEGKILNLKTTPEGKTVVEIELVKPTMRFISELIDWILRYSDPVLPGQDKDRTPQELLWPHKPFSPLEGTYVYACPNAPFLGTGAPIINQPVTTTTGTLIINPTDTNNINGENND